MTYDNPLFYDLMIKSYYDIDFMGIMGNTRFNSFGETSGMINFEQFRGLEAIFIKNKKYSVIQYTLYTLHSNCCH